MHSGGGGGGGGGVAHDLLYGGGYQPGGGGGAPAQTPSPRATAAAAPGSRPGSQPGERVGTGTPPSLLHDEDLDEGGVLSALAGHANLPEEALTPQAVVATAQLLEAWRLNSFAKQIAVLSGRRMPQLQQQRREYVAAWWRDALARRAFAEEQLVPHPTGVAARTPRVEGNALLMGREKRDVERGRLRALLADYAQPANPHRGAAGIADVLRIPDDHLPILATQAELLSGAKAPRQPQARREYLAQLYLRATVGEAGS